MSDRFDEMAFKIVVAYEAAVARRDDKNSVIAAALRSTWNEAIEAAAKKTEDDYEHWSFADKIRELKEPKR